MEISKIKQLYDCCESEQNERCGPLGSSPVKLKNKKVFN